MTAPLPGDDDFVVVPDEPGRLLRLAPAAERPRDDLDDAIDELLPDDEGGPTAFDGALVVVGALLLGWNLFLAGPGWAVVVGLIALGLGVVLPLRAAARAAADRRARRRREALVDRGRVLDTPTPPGRRRVAAHDRLVTVAASSGAPPDLAGNALGAAHEATSEVAALLEGRRPEAGPETSSVAARIEAIDALADALTAYRPSGDPTLDDLAVDPTLRVQAYEELDALGGPTALSRLDDVRNDPRLPRSEPG